MEHLQGMALQHIVWLISFAGHPWHFSNVEDAVLLNVQFFSVLEGLSFFRCVWQDVVVGPQQPFCQMVKASSLQLVFGLLLLLLVGWVLGNSL